MQISTIFSLSLGLFIFSCAKKENETLNFKSVHMNGVELQDKGSIPLTSGKQEVSFDICVEGENLSEGFIDIHEHGEGHDHNHGDEDPLHQDNFTGRKKLVFSDNKCVSVSYKDAEVEEEEYHVVIGVSNNKGKVIYFNVEIEGEEKPETKIK